MRPIRSEPYHLTTPILRRLLERRGWQHAILLTQWEVARKRAGVSGGTMMTAQAAPWFEFALHGRVPAHRFRPVPSVDGGILSITRRGSPLVPLDERRAYDRFVRDVFTARGHGLLAIVQGVTGRSCSSVTRAFAGLGIDPAGLSRGLSAEQWAALWQELGERPM